MINFVTRGPLDQISSLANGISYTDITRLTREAANNPALIANDSLHPSGHPTTFAWREIFYS